MSKKHQSLFGALLPSQADYKLILDDLRQKYDIPTLGPGDKDFAEFLFSESDIPWNNIHSELRYRIAALDELWPESVLRLRNMFKENPVIESDLEKFTKEYEPSPEELAQLTQRILGLVAPLIHKFEKMLDTTTDLLVTFLVTGETEDIPQDWIGAVQSINMFGEPVIMAIAGPLSDPKEISKQLVTEYHRIYGKDRPKITKGMLNASDLLRMKFEGVLIKDIADIYMERHPSQFAKDPRSPKYRTQKRRLEERLKKALQRYEKKVLKLFGDNSDT